MKKDIVSVIVPIYNAENYLNKSINSILKQTYYELEIILVNDGSTDNSWKICQEFQKKDKRIIAINQTNGGVSVARNKGLSIATGNWVMFVDPDDILEENIVSQLLKNREKDTDIIISSAYGFDKENKKRAHFFNGNRKFISNKTDLFVQLLDGTHGQSGDLFTAIGVPWGKLYRSSFLKKNNLRFDPKLRRMQDNIFNLYAFYYARAITYIDEPFYNYRLDNINTFKIKNKKDYEKIFGPVIETKYKALKELNLYTNSAIFEAYVNESAAMFVNIVESRLLRQDKYLSLSSLKEKDVFKDIFSNKKLIKDKKLRIKLNLINLGIYDKAYKFIK